MKLKENTFLYFSLMDYAAEICELHEIDMPDVQLNEVGTHIAQYHHKEDCITLRKRYDNDLDYCFALAHELRHKWQLEKGYITEYKNSSKFKNIEEYNNQEIELDAHAFAYAYIAIWYGVEPKFNGLSKDTIEKIKTLGNKMMFNISHDRTPAYSFK